MRILKLTIAIMSIMCLFGCKDKKEQPKYYMYNTHAYEIAIKDAKISLEEALKLAAKFCYTNKKVEGICFAHEIMRNDDYIIVYDYRRTNPKAKDYNVSGFWVNSKTGEVRDIKTKERIKNLNLLIPPDRRNPMRTGFITIYCLGFDDNGNVIQVEKL